MRRYSRELDGWDPPSFEVTREQAAAVSDEVAAEHLEVQTADDE